MAPENLFAGAYLDRRAEARLCEDWLARARDDRETLFVAMRGGAALTHTAGDRPARIAFLDHGDPRVAASPDGQMVLLGWWQHRRCVLVTLEKDAPAREPQEQFAELRPLANELPPAEAGLLA